jgi:hypothetical protein
MESVAQAHKRLILLSQDDISKLWFLLRGLISSVNQAKTSIYLRPCHLHVNFLFPNQLLSFPFNCFLNNNPLKNHHVPEILSQPRLFRNLIWDLIITVFQILVKDKQILDKGSNNLNKELYLVT